MAFLGPDGILVTEKNVGKVMQIIDDNLLPDPLLEVLVATSNERGLLEIVISRLLYRTR